MTFSLYFRIYVCNRQSMKTLIQTAALSEER